MVGELEHALRIYARIDIHIYIYTHQISCTKVAPRIHPSKDAAGNLRRWNTSQVAIPCGFPQPRCGGGNQCEPIVGILTQIQESSLTKSED